VAAYFFDSSAIVKRYLSEVGSVWVTNIAALVSGNEVYLARITFVEVISAVTRKSRGSGLSADGAMKAITDFRRDFANEYSLIEQTSTLVEWAADLAEAHALRAYDAVQLAAALEIDAYVKSAGVSKITLVSADGALNTAALAEGLAVDDPNTHS
jgi:predicted nucleic acid-binding protein